MKRIGSAGSSGDVREQRMIYVGRRSTPILLPPRYSPKEWQAESKFNEKCTNDGNEWAEKRMANTFRLIDEKAERSRRSQEQIQFQLEQRVKDIQLWEQQLTTQSEEISRQLDDLSTYQKRVENANKSIPPIIQIDFQVLRFREGRQGIDLVDDEPQSQTVNEIRLLEASKSTLEAFLTEIQENFRQLRKFWLQLSKELKDKKCAAEIDTLVLGLNEHSTHVQRQPPSKLNLDLSVVEDESEWEDNTRKYDLAAQKLIRNTQTLQVEIESYLRILCDQLQRQVCSTNAAFEKRLIELRQAKAKLERDHNQISIRIREMENVIDKIQKCLNEKESALALTETRLTLRSQRPNFELVKDMVQRTLKSELIGLKESISVVKVEIIESKKALRSLLSQQLALEEAINVKVQSISIDETEVMPLRRTVYIQQH